jgi:hypothetical protein
MSETLAQYLVPCITENNSILSDFVNTPPITCPNNINHEILIDGVRILSISKNKVYTIDQTSTIKTGGYYRTDFYELNSKANDTTNLDIKYLYNISVYSITLIPNDNNIGDEVTLLTAPDTEVTFNINPLKIGDKEMVVPTTNIGYIKPGFLLSIQNDSIMNNLGEVTSIDIEKGIITFSSLATDFFDVNSKVCITVQRIKNLVFANNNNIQLGLSKIGSAGLSSNTIARIFYKNNSSIDKTFSFLLELEH